MFNDVAETVTARFLLIGSSLITLFVITDTVTDPVNAPKLLLTGGLGFALFFVFLTFNLRHNFKKFWPLIVTVTLFNLFAINTILISNSPVSQQIYGSYGRNTGFIAYLALSFITLGCLNLRKESSFKSVILGLQFSGFVNVVYCSWVLLFGDFIKWNNQYGNILGTFGNPNFISAFLGIFISSLVANSFSPTMSNKYRLISGLIALLAFYQIYRSHAVQGVVVTVAGLGVIGFYVLRSKIKNQLVTFGYLVIFAIFGVISVLGALQKGPFDFIYKRTVSLRGIYWNTAINMSKEHPFTGVGLDSYGDWYRWARPLKALNDPGVNTTSNAAHNVPLDLLASGGWPLFVSYLVFLIFGANAIIRVTLRRRNYDGVFVALSVSWICYQLQSIISINQIGLALWGWILTGCLVAYELTTRTQHSSAEQSTNKKYRNRIRQKSVIISPQLVASIGLMIGIFVAAPPLSADSKWRGAMESRDAKKVMDALKPSFFNPSDSLRYAQAVQIFVGSNLLSEAHEITKEAIRFNPNHFQSWRSLYFISTATEEEKNLALQNLKRLDPLNPDVTS